MLESRKRLVTALAGFAVIGVVGLVPSSPAQAKPDIKDVQAQVDRLYREAEQASERYNDARLELEELQGDLSSLRADQARQNKAFTQVRNQVQDSIVRQYEGESLSAVGQVVISDDPQAFLARLSTMSAFNDVQSQLFDRYATQADELGIRRTATEKRAKQIARTEKELAADKAKVQKKYDEAKSLLGRLQAKERQEILSRSSARVPASVPASGRAAAAISYAMAQVGKAYVYGAAGPNAFDCSGLTMRAWGQAGVALPHSSSAQYGSGPHVAESDLQPGDLVFYYSPISHVGMYIGNGLIVNAENPSAGVKVTGLHSMPYVGAVRPG